MDSPRTWITREEIAEIAEARKRKLTHDLSKDKYTVLQEMEVMSKIGMLEGQIQTIRANIKLFSGRVGERV